MSTYTPASTRIWLSSKSYTNPLYGTRFTNWNIRVGDSYVGLDARSEAEAMKTLKYLMQHERAINGSVAAVETLLKAMPR
jgi:hypothetical protein